MDIVQKIRIKRTHADVEEAMREVEEKSKAFTEAHKGESAKEIIATMRGEEPVRQLIDKSNLVDELKMLKKIYSSGCSAEAKYRVEVYNEILSFLDTMEVVH